MKPIAHNLATLASAFLVAASLSQAQTIFDDFGDGNDAEWVRYDPIGLVTGGAVASSYGFPLGHTYRIQATPSPDQATFGPSRAGAYRPDASFSDFRLTVDLVDWDPSRDQAMSLFARGSNFGPGTTNGYILSYLSFPSVGGGALQLGRIDGEVPQAVNFIGVSNVTGVTLDPNKDYRLVFTGTGSDFIGEVFDLSDLTTSLAAVSGFDTTYADGFVGLFSATATPVPGGAFQNNGTDATFDHFSAVAIPETNATLLIPVLGGLALLRRRRS